MMPIADVIATDAYADNVNTQWVKLLSLLGMNVAYERCVGAELFTTDGRRIIDFLSGYCVHNTGHNHPAIIDALKDELDRSGPVMLGIEFTAPRRLALRAPFEAFAQIHPAMFGQILVMRLFRNANILTQTCGNDFMVLKVAPLLVVTAAQVAEFVSAVHDVVDFAHPRVHFGRKLWACRGERWRRERARVSVTQNKSKQKTAHRRSPGYLFHGEVNGCFHHRWWPSRISRRHRGASAWSQLRSG